MDKTQLDPVAAHIIGGYLHAATYSRQFMEDHGMPPTFMAKAHHMRAVVQASLSQDSNYELLPVYLEFGRVGFTDVGSGAELLLRSAAAVQIEREKNPDQFALFDVEGPTNPAGVTLVVYRFTREGLKLSVAPTIQIQGRKRLAALGVPEHVGLWPYETTVEPPPPFDQDRSDPFKDVGDLGDEQEEDGAQ